MSDLTWPQLAEELIERHAKPGEATRLRELYKALAAAAEECGKPPGADAEQAAYIALFYKMAGEPHPGLPAPVAQAKAGAVA